MKINVTLVLQLITQALYIMYKTNHSKYKALRKTKKYSDYIKDKLKRDKAYKFVEDFKREFDEVINEYPAKLRPTDYRALALSLLKDNQDDIDYRMKFFPKNILVETNESSTNEYKWPDNLYSRKLLLSPKGIDCKTDTPGIGGTPFTVMFNKEDFDRQELINKDNLPKLDLINKDYYFKGIDPYIE